MTDYPTFITVIGLSLLFIATLNYTPNQEECDLDELVIIVQDNGNLPVNVSILDKDDVPLNSFYGKTNDWGAMYILYNNSAESYYITAQYNDGLVKQKIECKNPQIIKR